MNDVRHSRSSIHLPGYDYSQNGYYFVTVCVHDRNRLFGDIVDGKMITNDYGEIVIQIWKSLLQMGIRLDVFQIMPDHFHGIIIIDRSHVGV